MRAIFALALLAACGGSQNTPCDASADGDAVDAAPEATSDDSGDAADEIDAPVRPANTFRLVAANITSGNNQAYEDPGIRIFQGLLPDVVLIQEFNYQSGTLRDLVDTAFGTNYSFFVEPTGTIPNGIVSRYPIMNAGSWVDASTTDRGFAWAYIDLPGATDLFAVSLHLLTSSATARDTEAKQVVSLVQANAPQGAYIAIGGDFNTDATTEAALADLGAVVVVAPPFPADQDGNTNTSTNRNRPHDWVLASPSLDAQKVAAWVGTSIYDDGLVFDSRVYTPLSDVAPVLATDSAVTGMQHMPVVRDFTISP
ncbi:MAG TPA: endonuclease/exonuclease/phosphatase family protein [Polyangiaceae bacterium]|jgi:endonuclease/exonuclease/phosphatase family metal-dependent hydrolase